MGSSFLIECLAMAAVILVVIRVSRLAVVSQLVVATMVVTMDAVTVAAEAANVAARPHFVTC